MKVLSATVFFLIAFAINEAHGSSPIEHVVTLMLENRAFDHIIGYMKSINPEIDGVDGSEFNYYDPANPKSGKVFVNNRAPYVDPNPGHSYEDTRIQVFGGADLTYLNPSPMNGFVKDAESMQKGWGPKIMSCFDPSKVPVITTLAQEFVLFDQYFSSVPGPTEVNRMYLHSGTSFGAADNEEYQLALGYPQKTIYNSLNDVGVSWAVYAPEVTTVLFFDRMREPSNLAHIHSFSDFETALRFQQLPSYSFIEPRYFGYSSIEPANDQHPSHDVSQGELLIKKVYELLRNSDYWNKTALIITYDEHGGFYDHVPPPQVGVPNPDGMSSSDPSFNFTRLGVRVPMIIVSPWVKKGRLVHQPENGPFSTSQYEHSSILSTLKNLFHLPSFLTKRDAWAAPFDFLFEELQSPRTDCPTELPSPPSNLYESEVAGTYGGHKQPLNELQQSLLKIPLLMTNPELVGDGLQDAINSFKTEQEASIFLRKWMASLKN